MFIQKCFAIYNRGYPLSFSHSRAEKGSSANWTGCSNPPSGANRSAENSHRTRFTCHPWSRSAIPTAMGSFYAVASRSEEHTSELQSLMRISYAVFCLKKKKQQYNKISKQLNTLCKYTIRTYTRHCQMNNEL